MGVAGVAVPPALSARGDAVGSWLMVLLWSDAARPSLGRAVTAVTVVVVVFTDTHGG
ncbi:hypothetical protein GCM10009562_32350 [Nocardioides aquaticus]